MVWPASLDSTAKPCISALVVAPAATTLPNAGCTTVVAAVGLQRSGRSIAPAAIIETDGVGLPSLPMRSCMRPVSLQCAQAWGKGCAMPLTDRAGGDRFRP